MAQDSLIDRMYRAMIESGRGWPATELARTFLKMSSVGPVTGSIVRGMLARDERFQEDSSGVWSARARRRAALESEPVVLIWVESGASRSPEQWRAHLKLLGEAPVGPIGGADPAAWRRAHREWRDRRLVTFQPGVLGRFVQWLGRRWALPEWGDPLDLLALARHALVLDGLPAAEALRLHDPAEWVHRWRLGTAREEPAGVPLPALEILWEALLERFGGSDEESLQSQVDASLGVRPVSFAAFAFGPDDLEAVPDASGTYRFLGEEGEILYIGKAVRLRRRLQSYFRPLPAERGKRDELLARIRRFEVQAHPSELEALVMESRGIRRHRPPWNVQIDVHEPDDPPPGTLWPLLFLAPGDDSRRVSAILLTEAESGWVFHLPREEALEPNEILIPWLEHELQTEPGSDGAHPMSRGAAKRPAPPTDAIRLDVPEARLALRYYRRETEQCTRFEMHHYRDVGELLRAARISARGA